METVTHVAEKPEDLVLVVTELLASTTSETVVIALKGDLGAGKTTFVQTLGRVLGVAETITSPTFTIMKQYEVTHPQFDQLVHIDLYRIESESELLPLKIAELMAEPRMIMCIEWPEVAPSLIPDTAMVVSFEIAEDETRLVTVDSWGG